MNETMTPQTSAHPADGSLGADPLSAPAQLGSAEAPGQPAEWRRHRGDRDSNNIPAVFYVDAAGQTAKFSEPSAPWTTSASSRAVPRSARRRWAADDTSAGLCPSGSAQQAPMRRCPPPSRVLGRPGGPQLGPSPAGRWPHFSPSGRAAIVYVDAHGGAAWPRQRGPARPRGDMASRGLPGSPSPAAASQRPRLLSVRGSAARSLGPAAGRLRSPVRPQQAGFRRRGIMLRRRRGTASRHIRDNGTGWRPRRSRARAPWMEDERVPVAYRLIRLLLSPPAEAG